MGRVVNASIAWLCLNDGDQPVGLSPIRADARQLTRMDTNPEGLVVDPLQELNQLSELVLR